MKSHKWYLLFAFLITMVVAYFALTATNNRIRNQHIEESLERLNTAFRASGLGQFEKSSGCGKTQVKYGEGATVCSSTLKVRYANQKNEEAKEKYITFRRILDASEYFKSTYDMPSELNIKYGSSSADGIYEEMETGILCSSVAMLTPDEHLEEERVDSTGILIFSFSCIIR